MDKAKQLYRQMVDIHAAHTRVRAILDSFPKRDKKDIPQNSPERRLRHMCERYENEMSKVALQYFDAIREDVRAQHQRSQIRLAA